MLTRQTIFSMALIFGLVSTSGAQEPPSPPPPASNVPQMTSAAPQQFPETVSYKLDEILVALRGIDNKIQTPQNESLFKKMKDDYLSNLVWEFLGYHREKGGILPLLITLISFLTAIVKLYMIFSGKKDNKNKPVYHIVDVVVSISFFGIASGTLWLLFGGPVITPAEPVDLVPLQEQLDRLQVSANQIQGSQLVLNSEGLSDTLAHATAICGNLLEENRSGFTATQEQISQIPTSVPGYGCISLLFLVAVTGATAAVWLVGQQKRWW